MSAAGGSVVETRPPLAHDEELVRVYVWQAPVRVAHWLIFFSILVLGFTGYYIYNPFIISRGNGVFLMATMRFVHEVTGFVFIGAILLRFYWFFKGNRWASWRNFLPLEKWWRHGFWNQIKYYLFLRRDPDSEVGHNPLAAAAYAVVYILAVLQILTGLALYDYVNGLGHGFLGWFSSLMSVQHAREIHFLILFAFLAFLVHHVYSAVLIGIEERSGLVGGMFSGYKFFPAAFVASDPAGHRHEQKVPAVPAGRSHKIRRRRRFGEEEAAPSPPAQPGAPQGPK